MDWNLKSRRPKWYDITALLDPAVVASASDVRVRRKDDRIEYTVGALTLSTSGIILPWGSLPIGYRPTWSQYALLGAAGESAEITANTGGGLVINGAGAGQRYRGSFTVWTSAAAPATHPGTEVA